MQIPDARRLSLEVLDSSVVVPPSRLQHSDRSPAGSPSGPLMGLRRVDASCVGLPKKKKKVKVPY